MSIFEKLKKQLIDDIESMTKADADRLPDTPMNTTSDTEPIRQKAILHDPYFDRSSTSFSLTRNKLTRLSNRVLRDVAMKDWLISTILQIRSDTLLRFSRRQERRFELGYRIVKRDHSSEMDAADHENIRMLEDFIYNCGRTDQVPKGEEMNFGEFLKLALWDALVIGHVSIEKVPTRSGGLHRFRPLPSESIYRIDPSANRQTLEEQVRSAQAAYGKPRSDNDPKNSGVINTVPIEYYKYVQVSVDGRTLNVFGDEDMIFKLFNPKNFVDANGYSTSMVEQAISLITNHLNVESYNSNYFTHGYAARGILHLKGTVTQNGLAAFRRQFYNTISASNNAWRTPIVAGLDDVQWIPMSGSAREMEYINYNSHIMRSICAQFQIDPIELGLDYLTTANGRSAGGAKESGQFKITYSRERGLVPLLMFFEDLINTEILPALDKDLANTYMFKFFGYTDETPQTEVTLRQAQMTTFASMNDLLRWEEKEKIDLKVADAPLNQAFWGLVEKNLTRGEIREYFFGDKGASQRRELQYIPADPMFMSWNQMLMTTEQMKKQEEMQKQQMEAQQQQQMAQDQKDAIKDKREQQAHDHEMAAQRSEHARLAVQAGQSPIEDLRDAAKSTGASSASNIGGKVMANPINVAARTEGEE